jgi:DNA-binding IclR family transcriptional regulator
MAAFNPTMERAILDRGFVRRTPFTIVDPARYRQVLRQVRTDGRRGLSGGAHHGAVLGGRPDHGAARGGAAGGRGDLGVGATSRLLGPRKIAVAQTVRRAASRVTEALSRS